MTTNEYYDKASNRLPKWTDDDRQHRRTTTIIQQSMSMRFYLRLLATRICKFHCHSCSTRGDIVTESFACQRYVTNQTDGSGTKLCVDCTMNKLARLIAPSSPCPIVRCTPTPDEETHIHPYQSILSLSYGLLILKVLDTNPNIQSVIAVSRILSTRQKRWDTLLV